jgi:hypothetical protein
MDEAKFHHVAEQRCKKDGCKYMSCLRSKPQTECMPLFRSFEQCKAREMQEIRQLWEEHGILATVDPIRKPDIVRDMYQKGKSIYK